MAYDERLFERMRDALERSHLTQVLERSARVETFRFGTSAEPLDLRDEPEGLAPTDDRTDLAGALSDAVGTERRRTGAVREPQVHPVDDQRLDRVAVPVETAKPRQVKVVWTRPRRCRGETGNG